MTIARLTLLLMLLLLQAACSEMQRLHNDILASEGDPAPVVEVSREVSSWLADMHALRARPAEELPAVLTAREEAFRARPILNNRMRLAALLIVGPDPIRDEKRARLLLNGVDPLPTNTGDREFISLLQQFLDGQQAYEQKLTVLWGQVTQQNRRINELEQQLKALTSIEQNIQQRDPPPVKGNGK